MNKTKPTGRLPAACSIAVSAAASERDGMQPAAGPGAAPTADADATADGDRPVLAVERSTGGAMKGAGTWTVMFPGGGGEAADTALPMAATGTCNAHVGAFGADAGAMGRLQGAFGAT